MASFEPVRDARDRIIGVNIVAEEISERKRAEAILRESQNALSASYAQIQDLLGRLISAQEGERARIARELHDDCNQRLAAMAIAIDNLRRGGLNSKTATAQALEDLQRRVITLSQNLREISHDLHPGVLQHAGLVMALRGSCAEVSGVHDLKVDFDAPPDLDPLPADMALCLYRVTQEALHNIVRHSGARNAHVTVARRFDEIVLTVTDDGRGFVRGRTNGLGLLSIDERVRLLNGTVSLQSAPGRGTTLSATIPVADAAAKPTLTGQPQ
jgi:two-component system sensor histidine kinase UhpB